MIPEIATDVYDLTLAELNGGRYRVFLFDGTTPTLVDAGLGDTTDAVVERLDELDVQPERLVVTHGDSDHRFGDGDDVGRFTAVHTPGHTPSAGSRSRQSTFSRRRHPRYPLCRRCSRRGTPQ